MLKREMAGSWQTGEMSLEWSTSVTSCWGVSKKPRGRPLASTDAAAVSSAASADSSAPSSSSSAGAVVSTMSAAAGALSKNPAGSLQAVQNAVRRHSLFPTPKFKVSQSQCHPAGPYPDGAAGAFAAVGSTA